MTFIVTWQERGKKEQSPEMSIVACQAFAEELWKRSDAVAEGRTADLAEILAQPFCIRIRRVDDSSIVGRESERAG